jgi:hypothetical protein
MSFFRMKKNLTDWLTGRESTSGGVRHLEVAAIAADCAVCQGYIDIKPSFARHCVPELFPLPEKAS